MPLRGSCDTCTDSKVGCTKEKPICARCEKRGFDCVYSPVKRVGRPMISRKKPDGDRNSVLSSVSRRSSLINTPNRRPSSSQNDDSSNNSMAAMAGMVGMAEGSSKMLVGGQPDPNNILTQNMMARPGSEPSSTPIFSVTPTQAPWLPSPYAFSNSDLSLHDSVAPTPTLSSAELDQLLNYATSQDTTFDTSRFDAEFFDMMNGDMVGKSSDADTLMFDTSTSNFPPFLDHNLPSLPLPATTTSHASESISSRSNSCESTESGSSNSTTATSNILGGDMTAWYTALQAPPDSSSTCTCVAQILGFFHDFTPQHNVRDPALTLNAMLSRNDNIIEAARKVLRCDCSKDAYVLVLVALLIHKALDWFDAASQRHDEPSDLDSNMVDLDAEDERGPRIVAHKILSKIGSVQAVVDCLAERLTALQSEGGITPESQDQDSTSSDVMGTGFAKSKNSLLTTVLVYKVEEDLRKRYRNFTRGIVARLRR